MLDHIIGMEIEGGISERRIVLGGFSQGGASALYAGIRQPHGLAGVCACACVRVFVCVCARAFVCVLMLMCVCRSAGALKLPATPTAHQRYHTFSGRQEHSDPPHSVYP